MPARFVEVTNPLEAARKSGSLEYVTSQINWDGSTWTNFNFSLYGMTNTTNMNTTLSRWTTVASRVEAPTGVARVCLCAAVVFWVVQRALVYWAARRAVKAFGHAHSE